MLTQKQIKNIHSLDAATALEIMHECAERLAVVSVQEYAEIMQIPRRTVYAKMESGSILFFNLGIHKLPVINI